MNIQRFFVIFLSFACCILLPLSFFIRIFEWMAIAVAVLLILCVVIWKRKLNTTIRIISYASVLWLIYSVSICEWWNSESYKKLFLGRYIGIQASEDSNTYLAKKQAIADLEFAIKYLKKIHPICIDGFPIEIEDEINIVRETICSYDSITVCDFRREIQSILSKFHDAHTVIYTNQMHIHRLSNIMIDSIAAINHTTISDLFSQNCSLYSYESEEWAKHNFVFDCTTIEGLKYNGINIEDSICYTIKDGQLYKDSKYSIDNFSTEAIEQSDSNGDNMISFAIYDSLQIGYLRLSSFEFYTLSAKRRLSNVLKHFFSQLSSHHCNCLVVDLRGNPGGNSSFVIKQLISFFPIETYNTYSSTTRHGPVMIHGKRIIKNKNSNNDVFFGRTYLLSSIYTFSAATLLTEVFQANNIAKVVGTQSGNAVNGYSNVVSFELPNSKLHLNVSKSVYKRVKEHLQSDFVIPDYYCNSDTAFTFVKSLIKKEIF